jgi:ectoine hydroxylase-related dioxygenase (phytanoyl-CoA dioxygenase family)
MTNFADFHHRVLPKAIAARDGGGAAARDVGGPGRSLALRLDDATAFTYRTTDTGVTIEPGDDAQVVAELDAAAFDDLLSERWSIFGLLFPGRLKVVRGTPERFVAWEAALTNLWFDRPIYGVDGVDLRDRDGGRLDVLGTFTLADDDTDLAHFLHTAGFAVIRDVFTAEEVAALDAEVRRLRSIATPDDGRSWWATNANGEEVCCRLTYTSERSELIAGLQDDPRLLRIASWHGSPLRPSPDRLDGFSVVIKNSAVTQGLSDLPWHRDCGMGGHPVLCPTLLIGIQLDRADAENGHLRYLAGSHHHTNRIDEVSRHPDWPVVPVVAEPGDVTVHYSHVLHVAPPPEGAAAHRRTLYVAFNNPAVFDVIPPGKGYNDVVYSHGDGRVRNPTELA